MESNRIEKSKLKVISEQQKELIIVDNKKKATPKPNNIKLISVNDDEQPHIKDITPPKTLNQDTTEFVGNCFFVIVLFYVVFAFCRIFLF